MDSTRRADFWVKFPGLVWSNSKASDSVMIMAALQRPRFHQLLAISEEFGVDRVLEEWKLLQTEDLPTSLVDMVSPMLENLRIRFKNATRTGPKRLAGVVR